MFRIFLSSKVSFPVIFWQPLTLHCRRVDNPHNISNHNEPCIVFARATKGNILLLVLNSASFTTKPFVRDASDGIIYQDALSLSLVHAAFYAHLA
jgi:hypothetical protein